MSTVVRNDERCWNCVFPRFGGWDRLLSLCIVTLAAGLLYPFVVHADEATGAAVRSGCEIDYPPFCIVHEDGRADGFSVELMRAALRNMGREVTFRTGPWAEVRGWLERSEVEALPLVGRTPEREELFDFTVPYMTMHGAIVVREETDNVHTLDDLRGRRVGVMQGDNAEEFLRREERGFEIVTAPTFADSFRDLAEDRCDAVVTQRLVALRLLKETGLTNLKIVERPIREFSQDFCFAVQEGDREMLSVLNEGLALAVADGTHRRLHAKWFAQFELPADRPIVVGGDHNYPPFEFLDDKGRPAGFTIDLTRAIAREMNMDVRIELGPWPEMVNALRDGRIDALEGMFYSPERDRTLDFSAKYLVIHCVSVVRQGEGPPPTTLEDLAGRNLVVQAEDAILDALAERRIEARITTVETQEDVVRAVAEGRNACGLATRFGALYAIDKNGWANIEVADQAFYSGEYCYAVPQGDDALLAEFTEGLRILKDSGEYQRIYEKWLGVYEEHFYWSDVLRLAGLIAAPLLLLAIMALLWSWSLKRQVRSRTRELRESEERFRVAQEMSPDGFTILHPVRNEHGEVVDFTWVYENQAIARINGTDPQVVVGKRLLDLFPAHRGTSVFETYLHVANTGNPQILGEVYVGEMISRPTWLRLVIVSMGESIAVLTVDITERKWAETELAHTNEVLSQLLDVARQLGVAMDTETVIQIIRRTARALSGADGVTVVLREDDQCYYVAEDAVEPLWKGKRFSMDQCISGWVMRHGQSVAIEDIYADPRVPQEAYRETFVRSLAMAPIGAENPIGAIGAYWRERHAPSKTEQSLLVALGNMTASIWDALLAREALKKSEETYRLLANNTVDCIWRLTLAGLFEYINPASEALLGYTPEEMIGTPLRAYCDDENYRIMEREIGVALNAPDDFKGTIFSAEMLRRDGSTITVEIVGKLLRAEDGSPAALQGVTRDITARMKIEAEREKLQSQLIQAQKMESVGRLAGGVAHDFNNILQVMMGYSQILLDALPDEGETHERVAEIYKGAERAADLTRQLLAFARKQTIAPKVLDLNETVESMLKMLRRLIGEDIDLAWEPAGGLWRVKVDPGQIDQILANLCVNARDAIEGVGKVTIETHNTTFDEAYCADHAGFVPGEFAMLAVSDDGCGMDEETRANIFEPFFTTKNLGEGTGLGLATVYGIVKQNDGFINVYSEPGEGTTFRVYLPRHAAEALSEERPAETGIYEGNGETVLFVEDDAAILRLGERMLASMNYDVHAFGAAGDALEFARTREDAVRLLITDVVMPEMSGRDLSNAILRICPDIRVLFMSGYTANVIAHRGVLDEGVNFIQKPFSPRDLAKKVREVLDS